MVGLSNNKVLPLCPDLVKLLFAPGKILVQSIQRILSDKTIQFILRYDRNALSLKQFQDFTIGVLIGIKILPDIICDLTINDKTPWLLTMLLSLI